MFWIGFLAGVLFLPFALGLLALYLWLTQNTNAWDAEIQRLEKDEIATGTP